MNKWRYMQKFDDNEYLQLNILKKRQKATTMKMKKS